MNPDKISNDKTVEINLQPSTYFPLTWRGSRFSLESQKREVCEPRNRRPKEKERFSEPQLNWEECSVPDKWPHGMEWPEGARNSERKWVRKQKDCTNPKLIKLYAGFSKKKKKRKKIKT